MKAGIVAMAVFFLMACSLASCDPDGNSQERDMKSGAGSASRSAAPPAKFGATHCRIDYATSPPRVWLIKQAEPKDFVSLQINKVDYDYFVFSSDQSPPGTRVIKILENDRIWITKNKKDEVTIQHVGSRPPPNTGFKAISQPLTPGDDRLWVEGVAEYPEGTVNGAYFFYMMDEVRDCEHPDYASLTCRRVHVEYFKDGLDTHKPQLSGPYRNVFPLGPRSECNNMTLQTDDGDGDEGLR